MRFSKIFLLLSLSVLVLSWSCRPRTSTSYDYYGGTSLGNGGSNCNSCCCCNNGTGDPAIKPKCSSVITVLTSLNDQPIAGASVTVYAPNEVRNFTTQSDGTVAVAALTDANYVLKVQKTGYQSSLTTFNVANAVCPLTTIKLDTINVNPDLCDIQILVLNKVGPLQGATLSFDGQSYTSDQNGIINIPDIEPGSYNYVLSAVDYDNLSGTLAFTADDPCPDALTMTMDPSIHEQCPVAIKVTENGKPVEAEVSIMGPLYTYKNNTSILVNIPVGLTYQSYGVKGKLSNAGKEGSIGGFESCPAVQPEVIVELTPDIHLEKVTFQVKDVNGVTVKDANIVVSRSTDNAIYSTITTDNDGKAYFLYRNDVSHTYRVNKLGYIENTSTFMVESNKLINVILNQ